MVKPKVLKKYQIEHEARNLLEGFYQCSIEKIQLPVPIEDIIESYLNISFELDNLEKRMNQSGVHGALFVEKNLIVIDSSLEPYENPHKLGRYRFTCAHEVGHNQLHVPLMKQSKLEGQMSLLQVPEEKPITLCRISEVTPPGKITDWLEWQADYFSACTLMPQELIRKDYLQFKENQRQRYPSQIPESFWQRFIQTMAKRYEVSVQAMTYRLEGLGFTPSETRPIPLQQLNNTL